jgi:hypothetical protein
VGIKGRVKAQRGNNTTQLNFVKTTGWLLSQLVL